MKKLFEIIKAFEYREEVKEEFILRKVEVNDLPCRVVIIGDKAIVEILDTLEKWSNLYFKKDTDSLSLEELLYLHNNTPDIITNLKNGVMIAHELINLLVVESIFEGTEISDYTWNITDDLREEGVKMEDLKQGLICKRKNKKEFIWRSILI